MGVQAKRAQYTVREVPLEEDRELRRRAARRRLSLNQVILSTLAEATLGRTQFAGFSDLVGQWPPDPAMDSALKSQRRVDREMWI